MTGALGSERDDGDKENAEFQRIYILFAPALNIPVAT
jgi:hypothetical protein